MHKDSGLIIARINEIFFQNYFVSKSHRLHYEQDPRQNNLECSLCLDQSHDLRWDPQVQ